MIWLIILAVLLFIAGLVLMNYNHLKKHSKLFDSVVDWIIDTDGWALKILGFIIVMAIVGPLIFNMFAAIKDIQPSSTIMANLTVGNESSTITLPVSFEGIDVKPLLLIAMIATPLFFIVSRFRLIWVPLIGIAIMLLFPNMGTWGCVTVAGISMWFIASNLFRIRMRRFD